MSDATEQQRLNGRLQELFGADARSETPLAQSGAGLRLTGVDLCRPLSEQQVEFLLDALGRFRIVCIAAIGKAQVEAILEHAVIQICNHK